MEGGFGFLLFFNMEAISLFSIFWFQQQYKAKCINFSTLNFVINSAMHVALKIAHTLFLDNGGLLTSVPILYVIISNWIILILFNNSLLITTPFTDQLLFIIDGFWVCWGVSYLMFYIYGLQNIINSDNFFINRNFSKQPSTIFKAKQVKLDYSRETIIKLRRQLKIMGYNISILKFIKNHKYLDQWLVQYLKYWKKTIRLVLLNPTQKSAAIMSIIYILIPLLEGISKITRSISLICRISLNLCANHILISILQSWSMIILTAVHGVTATLIFFSLSYLSVFVILYMELIVGLIQLYILTLLMLYYLTTDL